MPKSEKAGESDKSNEAFFDALNELERDPELEAFWQRALELESDDSLSNVEVVDELNEIWPYLDEPIIVSGRLEINQEDFNEPDDIEFEVEGSFQDTSRPGYFELLQARSMISSGFCCDGDIQKGTRTVSMLLEGAKGYSGTMQIGDIDHIEYPWKSYTHLEKELRYHFPELMDSIDSQVIEGCGNDKKQLNRLIHDFYVEVPQSLTDGYPLLRNLTEYIENRIKFDSLPYIVKINPMGNIYYKNENHYEVMPNISNYAESTLITVEGIRFTSLKEEYDEAAKDALLPCRLQIIGDIHSHDAQFESERVYIAGVDIKSIAPIRSKYSTPEIW